MFFNISRENISQIHKENIILPWSHASPFQPRLQMQMPAAQRPLPPQSAGRQSPWGTSHSGPFQPSEQWHTPPPYWPWPEQSTGQTPGGKRSIRNTKGYSKIRWETGWKGEAKHVKSVYKEKETLPNKL